MQRGQLAALESLDIALTVTALATNAAATATLPTPPTTSARPAMAAPALPKTQPPVHLHAVRAEHDLQHRAQRQPTPGGCTRNRHAYRPALTYRQPGLDGARPPDLPVQLWGATTPEFAAPHNPPTQNAAPYAFRYYSQTQNYLGFSGEDQHGYVLSVPTGLIDLGAASTWAPLAAGP